MAITLLLKKTPLMQFRKNLGHIAVFQNIAKDLEKHEVVKFETKVSYLYSSYIVYLVALWQTFLESLAQETFDAMVVSEPKSVFHENLRAGFSAVKHEFHSPKTSNINKLFKAAGIENITEYWRWKGMSNTQARKRVDNLVSIRNSIAHEAFSTESLSYQSNFDYMEFLYELAETMSEEANKKVKNATGKPLFGLHSHQNP